MRNINSLLAASDNTILIVCMTILAVLLFVVAVVVLWWTELRQKSFKDLGKSILSGLKRIGEKISPNKPVKTVYSDKSRNYSGTEFLPVPAKAPTKEYSYEFVGWDKNYVDENGNTVAKPIYIQKVNTCRINVYDDDEVTLLKTDVVEYGASLDLSNLKPTKPATKEFVYEFVGWDKETSAFYKNENVYAVYKAIPKKFTYTFYDSDGKSILSQTTAIYGTPILLPEPPETADKDSEFAYFKGYEEGMVLTKDESFVAVYRKSASKPELTISSEVMKKQSLSSLDFDRDEQVKSAGKVNTSNVEEPKAEGGFVKQAAVKVFNLAGASKSKIAGIDRQVKLNSETDFGNRTDDKKDVKVLKTKEENNKSAEDMAANITILSHKKDKK